MTSEPESNMTPELVAAIQLALDGHTEAAAIRLQALWTTLAEDDFFHRCVLAHYMADLQATPADELAWDKLALHAALAGSAACFDGRLPGVTRSQFFPSLYLNLASSYEKIGDVTAARNHAQLAWDHMHALDDTPLADLTRNAIERLCARLDVEA